MGTAGNIDKAIVGTGGAVVKGIDDLTLHHSDQLVENASKYPDADLAFSGDVDIPASIVDQYSKFGGTLVPDGNQDPYRVPQPAVRQDTNPNGNGFTDVLVIPAIDRRGIQLGPRFSSIPKAQLKGRMKFVYPLREL